MADGAQAIASRALVLPEAEALFRAGGGGIEFDEDGQFQRQGEVFRGADAALAQFGMFFGGRGEDRPNPIVQIVIMILAPIAGMLIQGSALSIRETTKAMGRCPDAGENAKAVAWDFLREQQKSIDSARTYL